MRSSPAVIHLTHEAAHAIEFDDESTHTSNLVRYAHATRQHGSIVRSQHEYFGAVCDLLDEFPRVVVAAGHTSLADFQHYLAKHRPRTTDRIAAFEVVDHPTDNQLVALARKRLEAVDRLA